MICIHNTAQVLGMHIAGSSIKVLSACTRCSRKGPPQHSKASSHFKWIVSSSQKYESGIEISLLENVRRTLKWNNIRLTISYMED